MKNKGFTLVELLAVIVILAIISIIAIPVIGNVIDESKKKALEVSANGLIESANYFTISNDGVYEFVFDENKKGETIKGEQLDYKGSIEGTGKLYIDQEGDISLCLVDDKYYVYKNYNSGIYVGEVKDNSCIIGYDVLTNKYVAMLDDGTGQVSNVYSKDEVNNLIDSVNINVTNNTNEITNIKGTIETLQNSLNSYALQSSLNETNTNLNNLSSIVSSNTIEIEKIKNNNITLDYSNSSLPSTTTTAEFLQILLNTNYPKRLNMLTEFNNYFGYWTPYAGSKSATASDITLSYNGTTGSTYDTTYYYTNEYIDLTYFSSLSFKGSFTSLNKGGNNTPATGVYLLDENNNLTQLFYQSFSNSSNGTFTYGIDKTVDLSNIKGNYKIGIRINAWKDYTSTLKITTFNLE